MFMDMYNPYIDTSGGLMKFDRFPESECLEKRILKGLLQMIGRVRTS
jgi:hypothetical protein